jgi:hypothetical protein
MTHNKSPEEYRWLAEKCRETARTISADNGRADLLARAEIWDLIADRLEPAPRPEFQVKLGPACWLSWAADDHAAVKNDGLSKSKSVTAVRSSEAGSVAAAQYVRQAIENGLVQGTRRTLTCYLHK